MLAVLIALSVYVVGDFTYSTVVDVRRSAWEAERTRNADGLLPGYEPIDAGQGETAILMIHGFGSSPGVFGRMAPALADEGFACRAMRLPGFGETVEAAAKVTWEDWYRAAEVEAERVKAAHGSLWVMGHSMGGTLAYRLARERPDLIDGVILFAPLLEVRSKRSLGIPPRPLFHMADRALLFTDVFENAFDVDLRDESLKDLELRYPFVAVETYREMFELLKEVREADAVPSQPVLVVVAKDDLVVDPDQAVAFFTERLDERSSVNVVTNAGHVLPLDAGWEHLAERVVSFVGQHERH